MTVNMFNCHSCNYGYVVDTWLLCIASQTMEMARNPAMLQELMRQQDRAMSNLEVNCAVCLVPYFFAANRVLNVFLDFHR